MHRFISTLFAVVFLFTAIPAQAALDDSETWKLAQKIVETYLEEYEDCSDFTFPLMDYRIARKKNVYSVYADVKYEDEDGENQRDYFGLIMKVDNNKLSNFTRMLGLRMVIFDAASDEVIVSYPYKD